MSPRSRGDGSRRGSSYDVAAGLLLRDVDTADLIVKQSADECKIHIKPGTSDARPWFGRVISDTDSLEKYLCLGQGRHVSVNAR